jgi:hypothetical protein
MLRGMTVLIRTSFFHPAGKNNDRTNARYRAEEKRQGRLKGKQRAGDYACRQEPDTDDGLRKADGGRF